jgi:chemotaxis protein methyltransferase CheR
MVELGIVDIREIIRLIKNHYNYDFSTFALTSLKYRLEYVISKNNLTSPESLFRKLSNQPDFFDTFLHQVFVPSTEMFRDPSFWRWLRETFFAQIDEKQLTNYKIWIPYCISGGELYTLAILLKELNLHNKIKIIATAFSKESVEYIKSGSYPLKKIEVSGENYKRFQGESEFENYYRTEKYEVIRDTSLIKNVEFIIDNIEYSNAPKNVKLILLRNVMIYYNPTFQDKVQSIMHEALAGNGNLAIGQKEQLKLNLNPSMIFEPVNLHESVYKRKLS